jgi:hypothetical protein
MARWIGRRTRQPLVLPAAARRSVPPRGEKVTTQRAPSHSVEVGNDLPSPATTHEACRILSRKLANSKGSVCCGERSSSAALRRATSMAEPATNKANAIDFYDLAFNRCRPRERSIATPEPSTGSTTLAWATANRRSSTTSSASPRSTRAKHVEFKRAGRRGRPRRSALLPALARRPRRRGHRHLPLRSGREDHRALGCAPDHPRASRQ